MNIYTVFQNQVPAYDRPRIKSISKSSPGWLDLLLNQDVAIGVARAVATLSAGAAIAVGSYHQIHKMLSDIAVSRKRNKVEQMRLTLDEAKIVTDMCDEMARFLGFRNLKELHRYTGNPEVTLKLMLAHFRRISTLVEYVENGKVALPVDSGYEQLS